MQPLTHLNPLFHTQRLNIVHHKRPPTPKDTSMTPSSTTIPAKRRQPPSSSSFAQSEASTSTLRAPAPPAVSSYAKKPLKKKVASSNDDTIATRMQPRLSEPSWRRAQSYQHADLNGPSRRTVLEWLPREVVFMILHLLSFRDIQSLIRADKRIRPLIHAPSFCPWRKTLASFLHRQRLYDESIALNEEALFDADGSDHDSDHEDQQDLTDANQAGRDTNSTRGGHVTNSASADQLKIEQDFLKAYTHLVVSLQLKGAPLDLLEFVPCLARLWHDHASFDFIRKWCRGFVVGRAAADQLFDALDHVVAVEVLCSVRLYLAVVRISRAFSQNLPPLQSVRILDYDCRTAINTFFQPDRILPATGANLAFQLTHEQDRFVRRDVRPGELIKVQAFAGTGKTRSLLAYAERRPHKRFLYIAFNKAAAEEARRRFPDHVQCRTMHSVALCQVVRTAGQDIGDLRARDVVRLLGDSLPEGQLVRSQAMATQGGGRDNRLTPTAVATYVLATLQRFFYSDDTTIDPDRHVPTKVATDTDLKIRAVARCAQELWDSIRQGSPDRSGKSVKCPHDAYVKLLQLQAPHHSENFFKAFDVLLLDEAQDLSAAQVSILLRAKKHCGILIVGDVFQKIYGFRGGTAKAFNERLYPSSAHFQLTKSFRFGDAVAKIATEMLGLRKPAPWEKVAPKPVLTGALGMADRVYAEASVFRFQLEPPPTTTTTEPTQATQQQHQEDPNGAAQAEMEPTQAAAATTNGANELGEGRQAVAFQVGSVGRIGSSDELICHTRIFRSNRKLCLTALALSASLPQPHRIFLKTSQALQPDAIVTLLRDAHILYHNDSRSMSRNSLLRDFASWKDLVQRVEAEGSGESKLSLAVALGGLLASNDFLEQVAQLETRFADTEEAATVILTTVHQAKGLEWDCVHVEDDFRPVFGTDKTQRVEVASCWHQDELNHLYVALTRAKRQLVVSKVVLQWIAAMRGLYRYRLLTSNSSTSLGKTRLCPHCNASKHPLVVKEHRLACFDFLNPRCNDAAGSSQHGASTGAVKDPAPLTQIMGCTGCLSDTQSAVHMDSLTDPDLALFVATAPKITRQRPHAPKQLEADAGASNDKKPTTAAATAPAAVKLDAAKHPFLKADHRPMKWAILHHEYKRAVYGWLGD
ncbi:related to DNA helicase Fdhp [Sporisorium reilianum f. sp. reilianum]|uniref:DNA 3'-5' helicase n=1 Tax=Sporisorium reilianum f. sp. reilianum TaxID=72559 RepID=A0A2N8UHT9_9BASI|nr:related to DNA helicase Fdhp [Sporisorium reilianum f. sp. reilianum]